MMGLCDTCRNTIVCPFEHNVHRTKCSLYEKANNPLDKIFKEYTTRSLMPIAIKPGDKIVILEHKENPPQSYSYYATLEKTKVSIEIERSKGFLTIKTDCFGELNPNTIKETFCQAIDKYYKSRQ